MQSARQVRRSVWHTLPRAAAAVLALLLSVLAGPRSGGDDRRAERISGDAALIAPIHGPLVEIRQTVHRAAIAHLIVATPLAVVQPQTPSSPTAQPLRDTPIAARAP